MIVAVQSCTEQCTEASPHTPVHTHTPTAGALLSPHKEGLHGSVSLTAAIAKPIHTGKRTGI